MFENHLFVEPSLCNVSVCQASCAQKLLCVKTRVQQHLCVKYFPEHLSAKASKGTYASKFLYVKVCAEKFACVKDPACKSVV